MAIDPKWLSKVRQKNQERFGMAGLGDLGYVSSQDLVGAIRREREARTVSLQRGRFEREDPTRPEPGSTEAILRAMGPAPEPPPPPAIPRSVYYAGGALALGLIGLAVWRSRS